MAYVIEEDLCVRCGACFDACASGAILGSARPRPAPVKKRGGLFRRRAVEAPAPAAQTAVDTPYVIDEDNCISCGMCAAICPTGAIVEE